MKNLIEKFIKNRNPNFKFDSAVNTKILVEFSFRVFISIIRGFKMYFFLRNPHKMMLEKNVSFKYLSKIKFGAFLKIERNTVLSGLGKTGIILGKNVSIGANSRVIVSTSLNQLGEHIILGNNVGIGEFAYLGGGGGLKIGDNCIVGQYLSCHPENHNYKSSEMLIKEQGVTRKGIEIGDNCWIGSKVTILDGVVIGSGCVIAAGAVVTKSFGENLVIGGIPAKVISTRILES